MIFRIYCFKISCSRFLILTIRFSVGIDISKGKSTVAVIDPFGNIVITCAFFLEQKTKIAS